MRRPSISYATQSLIGSMPDRMSILLSMIEVTEFTATANLSGTASSQPTRRRRPVLVATRCDPLADLVVQLRGERSRADPRGIGLGDAHDLVDLERSDAGTGACTGRDGIR